MADKTWSFFNQETSVKVPAPYLVIAMSGHNVWSPVERVCLAGITEVQFGRGGARSWQRSGATVRIELADGWMSSRHARMQLGTAGEPWSLIDCGSKNGCLVGGERVTERPLRAGDVIQMGTTMVVCGIAGSASGDRQLLPSAVDALETARPDLARVFAELARVIVTKIPVLITGETGTGKEVIANLIHERSRRGGAFVPVNCAALPDHLVESELFGFTRGAFSGADHERLGMVRRADGGTLFLDEVGELPEQAQAKLLRVLQDQRVQPLGAGVGTPVDVRIIAATNQDLDALVEAGRFRRDLLHRIDAHHLQLPALRDRPEDLGLICAALLHQIAGASVSLDRTATDALFRYAWPGNVRELKNALETAWSLANPDPIGLAHLPQKVRRAVAVDPQQSRRAELARLLTEHGGNVSAVARVMGVHRTQVDRWCKQMELDAKSFRTKT